MLSKTVFIVFAVGFISVVSGLNNAEQSAAYKAVFKCFKTGHDADTDSLEVQGIDATNEEMIASGCLFGKAFARCISELDPSVFSSPVPNIAHYVVALQWQQMVLANKADLCPDELPVSKLKEIVIALDILKKENVSNVEDDDYKRCVGDALKKCLVSASTKFEHHVDKNYLTALENYFKCFEEQAANDCKTPMLQHFVAIMKLHKKYFEKKHGKFEEMVEEIPA